MAKKKQSKSKYEHFTIVGLQYRLTKEARRMLVGKIPFSVVFEREKTNEHDSNAIAVFIAGNQFLAGQHIGYLRRTVAEVLAPKVDAGEISLPSYGIVDGLGTEAGTLEVKMAISKGKLTS